MNDVEVGWWGCKAETPSWVVGRNGSGPIVPASFTFVRPRTIHVLIHFKQRQSGRVWMYQTWSLRETENGIGRVISRSCRVINKRQYTRKAEPSNLRKCVLSYLLLLPRHAMSKPQANDSRCNYPKNALTVCCVSAGSPARS